MSSGSVDRARTGLALRLSRLRDRSPLVDHLWRAVQRYDGENGSRLAAAIAYYGFFATFALGVLLFAILGRTGRATKTAETTAEGYLEQNLPLHDAHTLVDASRGISALAVAAMVLAGIWWVEALRSSQRALWCVNQHPGNMLVRYLIDLGVLIALGLLLATSLTIALGLQDVVRWLAGDPTRPVTGTALQAWGYLLGITVDLVLASALLAGVPRLRIPLRRLVPSALLVVVGLQILKSAGRWYVDQMTRNPAYQLVAGTIGLLLFMYLFNQLTLLATALAATSTQGTVRDLAGGPPGTPVGQPSSGRTLAGDTVAGTGDDSCPAAPVAPPPDPGAGGPATGPGHDPPSITVPKVNAKSVHSTVNRGRLPAR